MVFFLVQCGGLSECCYNLYGIYPCLNVAITNGIIVVITFGIYHHQPSWRGCSAHWAIHLGCFLRLLRLGAQPAVLFRVVENNAAGKAKKREEWFGDGGLLIYDYIKLYIYIRDVEVFLLNESHSKIEDWRLLKEPREATNKTMACSCEQWFIPDMDTCFSNHYQTGHQATKQTIVKV